MKQYTKYTFFWDGPFSQWAPAVFNIDGTTFNCTEQYMMWKKAVLFNDHETAQLIYESANPRIQKALGRKVKGFDANMWDSVSRDVVFRGSAAKFTQNPSLCVNLTDTKDTLLVEASPFDTIWGIGLDAETAEKTPYVEWRGKNYLGQILTEVRELIIGG